MWTGTTNLACRQRADGEVRVVSHDISGLLKQMTEVFSSHGANIHNAQAKTTKDMKAVCILMSVSTTRIIRMKS